MRALGLAGVSWKDICAAPQRHRQIGWLVGLVLVAAVSGVIELLEPRAPSSGLGVLYLLAVLPVAAFWGTAPALGTSLLSAVALALFFVNVAKPSDGVALGVFVLTALVVSELSARSSREKRVAERLAEEQAALRRIATLVARGVPPAEVFSAVAGEMARWLPADSVFVNQFELDSFFTVVAVGGSPADIVTGDRRDVEPPGPIAAVAQTGRPARVDVLERSSPKLKERMRQSGFRSSVVTPIVVNGHIWGVVVAASRTDLLPVDTESRMLNFTELAATAIGNAHAHKELERVAAEQAAVSGLAMLVAEEAPSNEIFAAVVSELSRLLGLPRVALFRYGPGTTASVLASSEDDLSPALFEGWSFPADDRGVLASVLRTGRPVRIDDYANVDGAAGELSRELGLGSAVGVPVIVDGRTWGAVTVGLAPGRPPLPADTVDRLTAFTDLVATGIANAVARAEIERLAEEQAALRRVATLVAGGVPPEAVFAAVIEEVGRLLPVDMANMCRYEPDGSITFVATWGGADRRFSVGSRLTLGGENLGTLVFETGRTARIDNYADASGPLSVTARDGGLRSAVAAPIIVEGRLWGMMGAGSSVDQVLPRDAEARLASFTDLVAMAIANAESRAGLAWLAAEQAALRRVATLVAHATPAEELFPSVVEEVGRLLGADLVQMARYESDEVVTMLAGWAAEGGRRPLSDAWLLEGGELAAAISRTSRAARIDDEQKELGTVSSVGSPIIVEGRLCGALLVHSRTDQPLPLDTESRLEGFTDLLATAVANAESRSELAASRARIVAASDETRRRVERDLHDGAQQRLVALALMLRSAEAELPDDLEQVRAELSEVSLGLTAAMDELREISRGIHPAILSEGGLAPALKTLARRSPTPVALDVRVEGRLPERIEVAAYYVISEALANTAKHAEASAVHVDVVQADGVLRISVRDDGVGGADPARGSGLVGLHDRVEALDGKLVFQSARGAGTTVEVLLPLDGTGDVSDQDTRLPRVTVQPG